MTEKLKSGELITSFEVFPPKNDAPYAPVQSAVQSLAALQPDFMSVTYGAGGGTSKNTAAIASYIQNDLHIPALAHLTCASSTKQEVMEIVSDLRARGLQNILALRGDIPDGTDVFDGRHYAYASELICDLRSMGGFSIGAACYPEGQVGSDNLQTDLVHLKEKADAGADFLITQMFFDNSVLYSFLYRALKMGIDIPVLAGVMPVTNKAQINRICSLSGASLTPRFRRMVDKFGDRPEALRQAGIAYAAEQIIDLISNGVSGIHIYTMNKPEVAGAIMSALSSIL